MMDMSLFLFIGGPEVMVIIFFAVVFFGAKRIPEIARGLGQGINYVKNATNELKQEINDSVESSSDIKGAKDALKEGKQALDDLQDSVRRSTRL